MSSWTRTKTIWYGQDRSGLHVTRAPQCREKKKNNRTHFNESLKAYTLYARNWYREQWPVGISIIIRIVILYVFRQNSNYRRRVHDGDVINI